MYLKLPVVVPGGAAYWSDKHSKLTAMLMMPDISTSEPQPRLKEPLATPFESSCNSLSI